MHKFDCDLYFQTEWPELINAAVRTDAGQQAIFAVRREAYWHYGLKTAAYAVNDHFDYCPQTRLFYALEDGAPVAAVRACLNRFEGRQHPSPAMAIFGREITEAFSGTSYVEASRLVVLPGGGHTEFRRVMVAFQNVVATADEHDCSFILAPTRADHTRFYRGMGFEVIAGPRRYFDYPELTVLLALDWRRERNRLVSHRRYRHAFRPAHRANLNIGYTSKPLPSFADVALVS
jgi:hypothetical protein